MEMFGPEKVDQAPGLNQANNNQKCNLRNGPIQSIIVHFDGVLVKIDAEVLGVFCAVVDILHTLSQVINLTFRSCEHVSDFLLLFVVFCFWLNVVFHVQHHPHRGVLKCEGITKHISAMLFFSNL